MVGESQEAVGAGVGGASAAAGSNKMPTLSEYGTNLTQQAVEVWGGMGEVGRDERQHGNNPTQQAIPRRRGGGGERQGA